MYSRFFPISLALLMAVLPASAEPEIEYREWRSKPVAVDKEVAGKFYIASSELDKRPLGNVERIGARFGSVLMQKNPQLSPETGGAIVREFIQAYKRKYGSDRHLDYNETLKNARNLIPLALGAAAGKVDVRGVGNIVFDEWSRMEQRKRVEFSLALFSKYVEGGIPKQFGGSEKVLGRYRLMEDIQLAQRDPRVSEVMQLVLGESLGNLSFSKDSLQDWKDNFFESGRLFELEYNSQLEALQGGVVTRGQLEDALKAKASKSEIAKIDQEILKQLGITDSAIGAIKNSLDQFKAGEEGRRAKEEKRQKAERIINGRYQVGSASVELLAAILSTDDPKAGRILGAVGSATLELSKAIALKEAAVLTTEMVTSLGVATAIRLVTQLAFSGSDGHSVTQKMLGDMSQQIEQIHREMRSQFEGVHEHLRLLELYLRGELGDLKAGMLSMHQLQGETNKRITELQEAMRTLVGDQRVFEVNKSVNLCLRVDANGTISYSQFQECMATFLTCAQSASDSTSAGVDAGEVPIHELEDSEFYSRFASLPVGVPWKNIRLLKRAADRLNHPISTEELINPVPWSICAHYYLESATRYPDFYAKMDPTARQVSSMLQQGEVLRAAIDKLAHSSAEDGKTRWDGSLFASLADAHRSRIDKLKALILREKREFEAEQLQKYDLSLDGRQPHDGKLPFDQDQIEVSGVPKMARVLRPCPLPTVDEGIRVESLFPLPNILAPEGLEDRTEIPRVYRAAHDLLRAGLKFCYDVSPGDEFDFIGHYRYTIWVTFDDVPVTNLVLKVLHPQIRKSDIKPQSWAEYGKNALRIWDESARQSFARDAIPGPDAFRDPLGTYLKKFGKVNPEASNKWKAFKYQANLNSVGGWENWARDERLNQRVRLSKEILALFEQKRAELGLRLSQKLVGKVEKFAKIGNELNGTKHLALMYLALAFPETVNTLAAESGVRGEGAPPPTVPDYANPLRALSALGDDRVLEALANEYRVFPTRLHPDKRSDQDLINVFPDAVYRKSIVPESEHPITRKLYDTNGALSAALHNFFVHRRDKGAPHQEAHPLLDQTRDQLKLFIYALEGATNDALGL